MTAVLPATIMSLPSYPSETTSLQSANHQLTFDYDPNPTAEQQCRSTYNDTTSTTVTTNPHHHPADNCFEYFFHTTIFITVSIPFSFHSTVAIYFQHGSPIYFRHGTTIVDKSTNTFPTNHFQQTHFQQSARLIFFPLPHYRVSLLFQMKFPTLFRTNVITQIISILPPCSDFILFIGY